MRGTWAERVGFEPTRAFTLRAFQARALGHYATSPLPLDRCGQVKTLKPAERVGFEPTWRLTPIRFRDGPLMSTRAPLQMKGHLPPPSISTSPNEKPGFGADQPSTLHLTIPSSAISNAVPGYSGAANGSGGGTTELEGRRAGEAKTLCWTPNG